MRKKSANELKFDADKAAVVERHAAIVESFRTEVCSRSKEIDPNDEHDWYSLSHGYFLAKGVSIDDMIWLSLYVRYDKNYWT